MNQKLKHIVKNKEGINCKGINTKALICLWQQHLMNIKIYAKYEK